MPPTPSRFIPRGISISQIQKYIPRKWRQGTEQYDKPSTSCKSNDSVPETNTSSDESMINSLFTSLKDFASQGHLSKAFNTFSLIQLHASSSSSYDLILHPISFLLLSCINLKSLPQGQQLHAQIISLGLEQHPILVPKLVAFYSSFDLLAEARTITANSSILHPLPWNLLISAYVRNGIFGEALSAYKEMVDKGIRPDNFTYPSVLKACGEKLDLGFGREVHNSINASSAGWNLFVHNALVSMYGRFGEIDVARSLFDKMPEKDAQKKIEAAIRQKGIDENWAAALEHNPEAFARVVMLYVDMEVNGFPLKAFVDSGAQSTIISKSCAERCGLLRLMDQRYKGIAQGVGQSEILGRVHVAPIKIGNIFYPCSFTVLDSPNMEFLFGLDMLRKHQCIIDLNDNVLRVGGGEVSVPFLQEKDIPSRFLDEERLSKQASSSGTPVTSGTTDRSNIVPTGGSRGDISQGPDFEAKVAKLVELGFGREAVIQALKLFEGNEEQAAGFLFGG